MEVQQHCRNPLLNLPGSSFWRVKVEKTSQWALVFKYFQGKTMAKPFLPLLLRGSTIAIIMHMLQASTCGRVRAPGPTPSAPKQWKSDIHIKIAKKKNITQTLSAAI